MSEAPPKALKPNSDVTVEEWETMAFEELAARAQRLTELPAFDVPKNFFEANLHRHYDRGPSPAQKRVLKVIRDFQRYCVDYVSGR